MAKIEIDLEEYKSYQKTIENLNKEKFELLKKIGERDVKIEWLKENLEIVRNSNLLDRIFEWKQILNLISSDDEE